MWLGIFCKIKLFLSFSKLIPLPLWGSVAAGGKFFWEGCQQSTHRQTLLVGRFTGTPGSVGWSPATHLPHLGCGQCFLRADIFRHNWQMYPSQFPKRGIINLGYILLFWSLLIFPNGASDDVNTSFSLHHFPATVRCHDPWHPVLTISTQSFGLNIDIISSTQKTEGILSKSQIFL